MRSSSVRTDSLLLDPRVRREKWETTFLSPAAARASDARRFVPEPPCSIRTEFQRDRDRIIHSKAFRRLKYKTQVFLSPSGDHMRTRLTHTLEVTQIARTIARALDLNEDLTEAIALAHDLGHTPFGHAGERALARVFPGFRHNEQSLRVVDLLERDGAGLNLTDETRDGILRHSKPEGAIMGEVSGRPASAEAQVVKIADGIAYINHDFDDAVRGGMLTKNDLPGEVERVLGRRHSERINSLVSDVIAQSSPLLDGRPNGRQVIRMSDSVRGAADVLRNFLFENVYAPINALASTQHSQHIVQALFEHFVRHPESLPTMIAPSLEGESLERRVADVISGMTDRYALRCYETVFVMRSEEF
jgi:dGTPase